MSLNVTGNPASNVTLQDTLPAHLTFVTAGTPPDSGSFNYIAPSSLTWHWGSLPVGPISVSYVVKVDNQVQQGSVLTNHAQVSFDGGTPKSAQVGLSLTSLYTVKVAVYNETGELVKQIVVTEMSQPVNGFNLDNGTISSVNGVATVMFNGTPLTAWDGTNGSGALVTNGKYYLTATSTDSFGQTTSVSQVVLVSRTVATVEVDIYNAVGEIIKHLYSQANDPTDKPMTQVDLSTSFISPTQGQPSNASTTSSVTITSPNGVTVVWDGTSDLGSVVTNGHYEVEVHWTDGKGNQDVISRGILVQTRNNPVSDGTVYAQPNILNGGTTTTTLMVNSTASYTLRVGLYDVAGELIRTTVGVTGNNQAALDMSGLSSGLYFAVVDLINSKGGSEGRQTTQLVLQR